MGGVMNDILNERSKGVCIEIPDEDEMDDDKKSDSSDARDKISDALQESPSSKKPKSRIESNPDGNTRIDSHFPAVSKVEKEETLPAAVDKEIVDLVNNDPSEAIAKKSAGVSNKHKMDSLSGETEVFSFDPDADTKPPSTTKTRFIVTCQPLGSKRKEMATGVPGDVYSETLDEQLDLDDITFSRGTREELDGRRKSKHMERSKIRRHVQEVMERLNGYASMNIKEYMESIEQWHQSLLFQSPFGDSEASTPYEITVALPPGIQNLGATCYLNTQLQCLAQNPVFLEGIFSWRAVNNSHNMNGVMTKLQKLLAQMVVGGNRTLSTLEFSNALGLEHNEQQDPNEFGRLLFDRMEESFQQCSDEANGASNATSLDLKDLLKRIFQGETTYETTCMKCGNVTKRCEGFMDLNLPIVGRASVEEDNNKNEDNNNSSSGLKRKKPKKGTFEEAFDQVADSDVQFCLDQCMQAEFLDGDNQYFCEKCNGKQDAKRVPKLTELPPVLNVQLSRYVFDRKQFVKKKLTDKVLLPSVLEVDGANNAPQKKSYVLCGVMRHQGTSAHSGHYIAEAMDWTTGLWYEFNDEIVKVLPNGPSCSYIPSFLPEESSMDGEEDSHEFPMTFHGSRDAYESRISGSQDAYNMYYVDEDYLSTKAHETIERRRGISSLTSTETKEQDGVIVDVISERENKYSLLRE
jgi:ubiquitin carboxyl-terminal hydrolase 48